ncbi:MAG: RDD family protein [Chloroflexi bacterium]|nr:RDD family protein [Chloroflexota bacterium]
MEIDEILTIDTPENVVFGYDVAGIGSRFLAALGDSIIILVLQALVYLTLFFTIGGVDYFEEGNPGWIIAIFSLIGFALLWGYYIFFEMLWNGQSPGKRWAGLRVIRADGTPITLTESLIRNLVRLVDFLPIYYGIGVVTMFINEQSRRLGDLAAGTLVVRERKNVAISTLEESVYERNLGGFRFTPDELEAALPVEKLTDKDIAIAKDFLQRRAILPNRSSLGQSIAQSLYEKMEIPLPATREWQIEKTIAIVVRIYRDKNLRE